MDTSGGAALPAAGRRGLSALRREVTRPRPNHQLAVISGRVSLYTDIAECAVPVCVAGIIGESVLVANVAGDLNTRWLHVGQGLGEIGLTARDLSKFFQDLARVFGAAAMHLEESAGQLVAQQADAIDDSVRFLRRPNQFFKGIPARVILAVGDRENNLFVAVAELKVTDVRIEGVIQGS